MGNDIAWMCEKKDPPNNKHWCACVCVITNCEFNFDEYIM